jgi:hypothetical protein
MILRPCRCSKRIVSRQPAGEIWYRRTNGTIQRPHKLQNGRAGVSARRRDRGAVERPRQAAGCHARLPFDARHQSVSRRWSRKGEKSLSQGWKAKLREPISIFTGILAIATALLVGVGILQLCTLNKTDATLRAQQRAWIEPGPPMVFGPFNDKLPINLLIKYRNIGKEPAINAVIQLDEPLLVVDPPPDGNWYPLLPGKNPVCKRAAPNSGGIIIYPSTSNEFKAHVYPNQPLVDASKVFGQTKILVIEGCIGYQTVEKSYYAGFCYYWTPVAGKTPDQWGVTQCQTRNDAF